MARDENIKIFQEKEDPKLQEAVKRSVAEQKLIRRLWQLRFPCDRPLQKVL